MRKCWKLGIAEKWGDNAWRATFWRNVALSLAGIVAVGVFYLVQLSDTPERLTCEELRGSWQRYAGAWMEIECPIDEVDNWKNRMLFINTVPFVYGERESYTSFQLVSFYPELEGCLKPFEGERVVVWGKIGGYEGRGQAMVTDCEQVLEVVDGP